MYHKQSSDPFALTATLPDLDIAGLLEKELAPIRVKSSHRAAHACDDCRRRKTKCSGERPVCASCKERGKVCLWTPFKSRNRKPCETRIQSQPLLPAPVVQLPHVAVSRPTYPSTLLPEPPAAWLIADTVLSLPQENLTNPCIVKPTVQVPAGLSMLAEYDPPSPPSSCLSLRSDVSSCGLGPSHTAQVTPALTTAFSYTIEESPQNSDGLEAFLRKLYQCIPSDEWSALQLDASMELRRPV